MRINICVVINKNQQAHNQQAYNQCTYALIITKNFHIKQKKIYLSNIKKLFCFVKYKSDKFIFRWAQIKTNSTN